ncbi:hypothetical protein BDV95DRAFT_628482 [Massariosphaeria phaeospora]|uniref:DUF7779 domain-containing protein n=1 Tax=Massariosphaeria phaeospora TaxID=100035 RepID=A0A7C8I6L3_9PLEO|nr:hypothetical protein BDV95DRAFT_628482 [Massariosphaeria phaeospora]
MVPFSRDDLFVSRESVIATISECRVAAPAHTRMALVGLGSVGKSQIAIEYAYRIQTAEPHMLVQEYKDIADKLVLPGWEDPKADVLQLLMILDNVDDDGVFFGNDENSAAHGTILITSRNNIAATNLVGGHGGVVEVEPMGEDEALALLHTRVPFGESSGADAKALVHALERIPLAITHARAYIKTRASTTTISTYLELFRESEANQQISFQHIQKTEPSAADLLALMSMFDKQGIPRWLLQGTTSQLDFDDALAPLVSFSMVRTEIGEQAVAMHRLVQLSMRRWLAAEKELGKWVKESIQALKQCKVLLFYLKEVASHTTEDKEGLKKQAKCSLSAGWYLLLGGEYAAAEGYLRLSLDIRKKLGTVLERQGKYDEAEAMHRRDLEGSEKVLGREHPDTLGKYDEAEAMHRRDLEGSEKVLGREHPDTLTSVYRLAFFSHQEQHYSAAVSLYQRAYEGYVKVLGVQHPTAAACLGHYESALQHIEV